MKQHQPLTHAALYARVSSDRQDVDLSVAAQMRALRDYAKANGYVVAREYIDEAESGRIADRPEFRRMIDDGSCANAPVEVIPVWKFSRFTQKEGARRGLMTTRFMCGPSSPGSSTTVSRMVPIALICGACHQR